MSVSESEILKNKGARIAIIYSLDNLFAYSIYIYHREKSYYIGKKSRPDTFRNMQEAIKACHNHKADIAYLALSNTYQEVDATTDSLHTRSPRYDYQKVTL